MTASDCAYHDLARGQAFTANRKSVTNDVVMLVERKPAA